MDALKRQVNYQNKKLKKKLKEDHKITDSHYET